MKSKCLLRSCFTQLLCLGLLAASPVKAVTVLGYWRMGENDPGATAGGSATNTADMTGVFTLTNTPYLGGFPVYTTNVSASAASAVGSQYALQFSGNQYATGSLVTNAIDNFGIELWVKPADTTGTKALAYNGNTSSSGWGIFQIGSTYQALFGGLAIFGSGTATANTWTHLALVRDNGTTTLYINGSASGATTSAPNPPVGNFLLAANNLHGETFTGTIDEVRVFTFSGGFNPTNLLYFQNIPAMLGFTSASVGAVAGTNSVNLTVNSPGTPWTASANASWLHLATNSGTGNAAVTFSYDNNTYAPRTGTLTIAGQTLTVTQGAPSYSLSGNYDFYWTGDIFEVPASAGSNSITINVTPNTGIWSVTSYASWIHPTPNGVGSGTISFTYDANTDPTGAARAGQVYINNGANSLLRFIVFQQAPSSGTAQATYRFTGHLKAYLPEYVPGDASAALKSVQDGDVFYLTMTLVPSSLNIYYETWPCAVNNIVFSVPSRGLVYTKSFDDLEVLHDGNNPDTLRWDADGVDSTVDMLFWARDFNNAALASGSVPNPLNLSGFHANGFSQVILFNGVGQNPELFYGDLVPVPALSLQRGQSTNTISWVTSDSAYTPQLQVSSTMGSNAAWTNVTNALMQQGLTNMIALPATNNGAQFFRLKVL